jgi:large subunit ribosomal protein L4e
MMKINVYGVNGEITGEIPLPKQFEEPVRLDLIKKAVHVIRHNRRQPYGSDPFSGKKNAVHAIRPGRGVSRVPRLSQGRRAAFAPGTVGGRRAHPPKPEKNLIKKINQKEMALAKQSAMAALADKVYVTSRGHRFDDNLTLPIIVDKELEEMEQTAKMMTFMRTLGISNDIERAKDGRHIRAGKGKKRGRKYKQPHSVLMVVSNKEKIQRAASNLPGVKILTPAEVNVEHLAPGGHPARLTLFTTAALKELK